jgi:hypothetical protein
MRVSTRVANLSALTSTHLFALNITNYPQTSASTEVAIGGQIPGLTVPGQFKAKPSPDTGQTAKGKPEPSAGYYGPPAETALPCKDESCNPSTEPVSDTASNVSIDLLLYT